MPGFVFNMVIETFEVASGFFISRENDGVRYYAVLSPEY